jgi:hypothetical protein
MDGDGWMDVVQRVCIMAEVTAATGVTAPVTTITAAAPTVTPTAPAPRSSPV